MDKLNDLQRLPVDFFYDVLELLHADSALVSLSQVNRDMNEGREDIEEDDEDMDVLFSYNLMSGLANNYRRQCRYVRKLTVRNGYTKASNNGTRWGAPGKV
ncbi:hypothetical protein VE02_08907 [Pseudogymnoascus sp. 03VT05]|nr:hypothetical protein VE02_08907 [Pseudogymnoascus sp. 03VT05]